MQKNWLNWHIITLLIAAIAGGLIGQILEGIGLALYNHSNPWNGDFSIWTFYSSIIAGVSMVPVVSYYFNKKSLLAIVVSTIAVCLLPIYYGLTNGIAIFYFPLVAITVAIVVLYVLRQKVLIIVIAALLLDILEIAMDSIGIIVPIAIYVQLLSLVDLLYKDRLSNIDKQTMMRWMVVQIVPYLLVFPLLVQGMLASNTLILSIGVDVVTVLMMSVFVSYWIYSARRKLADDTTNSTK